MEDYLINSLSDLNKMRSAPNLSNRKNKELLNELKTVLADADWFTIGIMAPSSKLAIFTLKEMETLFKWSAMNIVEQSKEDGPVFLKANQKTGDIHVRIEYGLGEGILLGCHSQTHEEDFEIFGPLPLNFFNPKN